MQPTNSPYTLPEIGQKFADPANRVGVAARFPAPAVQKRIAVDLARIGHDDALRRDVELAIGSTATPHHANRRYLRRTVPGIGELRSLVRLDDIPDRQRFPRGPAFVSYGRLVKGATAAAGQR
jgi:hypothetical protein